MCKTGFNISEKSFVTDLESIEIIKGERKISLIEKIEKAV